LEDIPFMKADLVRKYLAPSPATSKGRMKRTRTGIQIQSTRKQNKMEETSEGDQVTNDEQGVVATNVSPTNVIPIETNDESVCNVFCYAALADKHDGTMHGCYWSITSCVIGRKSILFCGICI
jgi:hypothetical protein